eukprot:m.390272 g.390272  ORF g.390272 m.390272 type:complete len:303 (-) comp21055_c4_seq45:2681-3589(-)
MAQLTVVVPVHPDEECTTIAECCHFLKVNAAQQPPVPALFVTAYDRLTDKETSAAWLRSQHPSAEWVHEKTATTRAKAMNEGFSRVKTQFVLFVHCDTRVPKDYDRLVLDRLQAVKFCTFQLGFLQSNTVLDIIQWSVNSVRGFPYGDQCFGVRSSFHRKVGQFKDIPFMEDFDYVASNLTPQDRQDAVIPVIALTSARRFQTMNGQSSNIAALLNCLHNRRCIRLWRHHRPTSAAESSAFVNSLAQDYYQHGLAPYHGCRTTWEMSLSLVTICSRMILSWIADTGTTLCVGVGLAIAVGVF